MIKLVIFDWKRTLYDPDLKKLIPGAKNLLKLIKANKIPMVLIGKGEQEMHEEVKKLNIAHFFKNIVFVGEQKNAALFKPFISEINPKECLFIGDRVRSELEIGKTLGAKTLWVKQGKFANEFPENKPQKPDYEVSSLEDCYNLISQNFFN